MIRLNAMDQAFLLLETEHRPMNIGAVLILAPPAGLRGNLARHVVTSMLEVPVGPPFNHRLQIGPGGLGRGFAIDAEVDASSRVHSHVLPAPGDRTTLFDAVCRIHEQRLDRSEPLWQVHIFEGLPEGRVGLYFKAHHVLIDGIGFLHVFNRVVSRSSPGTKPQAIWEGYGREKPAPKVIRQENPLVRLVDTAVGTAGNLLGAGTLAARMLMRGAGAGVGLPMPFIDTPDALKAAPSAHRVLGHCILDLPRVRNVAKLGGGTINDVLLTTLDIALTRYSAERDAAPDRPLIADMPIALSKDAGTGNRVAILQVPLGNPGRSPAERFRDVRAETIRIKEEIRATPDTVLELYTFLTHSVASAIESLQLTGLPMLANAVVSNPYGITEPVFYNRCPVEMAIPVSVVAHHQTVNITATTYIKGLNITFIATREALPDVQRVADYTVQALDELERELRAATGNGSHIAAKAKSTSKAAVRRPAGRKAAGPKRAASAKTRTRRRRKAT